ncbi:hypothetical protein C5167_042000 [Papaver somniferum]|nr:hypothetical protein C5167_042000 [Papaver somniferum]
MWPSLTMYLTLLTCICSLSYNMRMKLVLLSPLTNMFPWVTVNKVPVYDDYDNFLKAVCKAYKGISSA